MNECLASQQTAERNWCTDSEIRVDLFSFFFFYIKKQNTAGGEEAEGRAGDERMGGGWREKGGVLCLFSKCRRNTVLSSHVGFITLQPTYCKAPSVRGPVKRGAVCPRWSSLSPRL